MSLVGLDSQVQFLRIDVPRLGSYQHRAILIPEEQLQTQKKGKPGREGSSMAPRKDALRKDGVPRKALVGRDAGWSSEPLQL